MNKIKIAILLLLFSMASLAQATVIVGSSAAWSQSTVITPGGTSGNWTNPTLPVPGVSTFTKAVTIGPSVVSPGAASLGVAAIASGSDVTYYRTTFLLDPFSSVTAAVKFAVDNDLAIWINNTFVAANVSLTGANWTGPLPSFDIASNGTITNLLKIDQAAASFTGFKAGTNELILAVRNLGGGDSGGFGFRMDINTVTVPEPATALLMLLGVAAMMTTYRRKSA